MQIKDWERKDKKQKTIWKHEQGGYIVLSPIDKYMYKLSLYDKAGREHFRVLDTNKTKLEHQSALWQNDYNKFRRNKRKLTKLVKVK
jgi:hypothetical protein